MDQVHPYMANSAAGSRAAMMSALGIDDVEQLFDQIPADHRGTVAVEVPGIVSEAALRRELDGRLRGTVSTQTHLSFLGGGYWNHYVPSLCDEVAARPEVATSVWGTPSSDLGRNQAWFEFSSQLGALLDTEFVGLPVYSWGCATGHALRMAARLTGRDVVLLPDTVDPERRQVIDTYCGTSDLAGSLTVREIPVDPATGTLDLEALRALVDDRTAAVYVETPNAWGVVEHEVQAAVDLAHSVGAEAVVSVDPTSLGVLRPPGSFGADIVVGSIQPLGIPLNAGGGVGGFIATRDEERYARQFPTLQVSAAPTSRPGELAFGMTLFEQSSYGSRELAKDWTGNSVYLWAVRAAVYMTLLGPQGFAELGTSLIRNVRTSAALIATVPGVTVRHADRAFKELVVDLSGTSRTVAEVNAGLLERGILGGHDLTGSHPALDGCALYCITEVHTEDDVHALVDALMEVCA